MILNTGFQYENPNSSYTKVGANLKEYVVGRDKQVSSDLKNTEVNVETASDPPVRIFEHLTPFILQIEYQLQLSSWIMYSANILFNWVVQK